MAPARSATRCWARSCRVSALVVTCFAIAVVSHGGTDEHDGRTEQVLATATSRSRAFLATASWRSAGATWLLLVTGVALALGVGNDTDHSFAPAGRLARSPRRPRCGRSSRWPCYASPGAAGGRSLGWGVVVLFATLGQIGELLDLPQLGAGPVAVHPRAGMPLEYFTPGRRWC